MLTLTLILFPLAALKIRIQTFGYAPLCLTKMDRPSPGSAAAAGAGGGQGSRYRNSFSSLFGVYRLLRRAVPRRAVACRAVPCRAAGLLRATRLGFQTDVLRTSRYRLDWTSGYPVRLAWSER